MTTSHFDQKLEEGHAAERRVLAKLYNSGFTVGKGGDTSSHDFHASRNGCTYRVEVKCEDNYAESMNICIEMFQGAHRGIGDLARTPSGIYVSEATVVVHTLDKFVALYRRSRMLCALHEHESGKRVLPSRNGGDLSMQCFAGADNGNIGYVVPIAAFSHDDWFDYRPFDEVGESPIWEFGESRKGDHV